MIDPTYDTLLAGTLVALGLLVGFFVGLYIGVVHIDVRVIRHPRAPRWPSTHRRAPTRRVSSA